MEPEQTMIILGILLALVLAWDVWLAFDGEPGNTISQVIAKSSRRWSIIPFGIGLLCGHFFWPV